MENKRYLKKFSSQSDYELQKDEVMGMPHIVLLDDTKSLAYCNTNNKFPQEEALYVLKTIDGQMVYVDAKNQPYIGAEDENNSKFVWVFEDAKNGMYYIKNLHTQSYISDVLVNEQVIMGETPLLLRVEVIDELQGIVSITTVNGHSLYGQNDGKVIGYTNNQESKILWYLEKEEEDSIAYSVTLGANTSGDDTKAYSTLCLAYNTMIPEGVTALIIEGVDENNKAIMKNITGGILPANTSVLLSSEVANTVQFKYTTLESTFEAKDNMLQGTYCNEVIYCGEVYNVYMLGKKNGRVAFYWTYENRDENGTKLTINGSTNHNEGGYVMCNANKAYLKVKEQNNDNKTIWIND